MPCLTPGAQLLRQRGKAKYYVFSPKNLAVKTQAVQVLQTLVPTHYVQPLTVRKWLKKWGYKETLETLKNDLPEGKKARSGDIGEILATEYVNRQLDFTVPIFRLRWRDHRELALRGDDILAVKLELPGRVHFLKGEAKSRVTLSADVVDDALKTLGAHRGRPSPHTLNYVIKRLNDLGKDQLADSLDDYLSRRQIPQHRVTHFLFAVSGNDPAPFLQPYYAGYTGHITQLVIGMRVRGHGKFVAAVFDGVSLA
jgi:hypothetical protein